MLARLEPLLKFARQDVDSADTFVSAYTVNLLAVITRPSPCNSSDAPALPHLLMPRVNECYCMRVAVPTMTAKSFGISLSEVMCLVMDIRDRTK